MSPSIASVVCGCVILGLFWLDRNQRVRTSGALWIPVIWFSIACSRAVSAWLQMGEPLQSADQVLEGSPIDRLFYSALMAVGIVVLVGRRRLVGRILRANGPILLFFFYCLVSLGWSDYPDVGFKRWTKGVGDLVMVLIILSDREPLGAVERLFARTTYLLMPLSVLFIKYYPSLGRDWGYWGGETSYQGVTLNKNTLGMICLCFGMGALWRFLAAYRTQEVTGRTRRMIAQAVSLAMVLWLLVMASSMTSLSCFLMGSALLLTTNLRVVIRRPAAVHVLVAAMLVVSASVVFLGASPGALKFMGRNPTLTDRTQLWGILLSLVQNPWVGTGFESFWLGPRLQTIWKLYWWHPNEAHNGYLEVFLNIGWVGLALLVVFLASTYWKLFIAWRNNTLIGGLGLAYFFAGIVFNFTEAAFFRMQAPVWIFFVLAAVGAPTISYGRAIASSQDSESASWPER